MSTIETNITKPLLRRQQSYCCQALQYFCSQKSTLIDTLQIVPRIILYKKPLKVGKTYETIVVIGNYGLHYRRLVYSSDSEDVIILVKTKKALHQCVDAEQGLELIVSLQPKTKLNIHRRRHIFIQSDHPKLTFVLPIITILKDDATPSLPESIEFLSSCLGNVSFYEMIVYNRSLQKLSFSMKCRCPYLTIIASKFCIPKQDYIKILLKLECEKTVHIEDVIKLKFGPDSYNVPFVHHALEWYLYINTLQIHFDNMKFKRTATKSFRICNESKDSFMRINLKFKTDEDDVEIKTPLHRAYNSIDRSSSQLIVQLQNSAIDDKYSWKHFDVEPKCGTIAPYTSATITVTFKPIMHCRFDPSYIPPFLVVANLLVNVKDEKINDERTIVICGSILGTDIDIKPKTIEFQNVYFGEEHCANMEVTNLDSVTDCHVDFVENMGPEDANVVITPEAGLDLKPNATGQFHLQFYAKTVGKLLVRLKFKIKNGGFFYTMVKGFFQQVRVKCFPDMIEMGLLPICVPQKRLVLVINPLMVPVTVQCVVPETGAETPLILNIIDTNEYLPVQVDDPVYLLKKCLEDELQEPPYRDSTTYRKETDEECGVTECESAEDDEGTESSLLTFRSVDDAVSSFSSEFQENVLDAIPDLAISLRNYLRQMKIFDKPDMERKCIEETMNSLLKTPYFQNIDKHKNYCHMDWNALPSDPKEIFCNDEVIYLTPNTGKAITVLIIPNTVGRQQKYLELRVCPIVPPPCDDENSNLRQLVDSGHLKTKLWIEYNCSVPEVMWDNVIDMQDALYCGELYDFEMIFENCSRIGGFFYYEIIPDNEYGCVRFINNRWKYFVAPGAVEKVPCAVEFKKSGNITLYGLIKFVGVSMGYPFHIKSEVLPPKIEYSPRQIEKRMPVLETRRYYVFIDNVTPTTTWIRLELKHDTNISLCPEGAQLAPTKQGMCVTLTVFYKDPGIYHNMLFIHMQYETTQKIPITLNVEGMPIFFEPDICSTGLNMGFVLCITEYEKYLGTPSFTKSIRVINKGERKYRITITKTKSTMANAALCKINPFMAKVTINPHIIIMEPMSEDYFVIAASACDEFSLHNEFRVDVTDLSEPKRKQTTRFILTADFIHPQLVWNRRQITMDYHRTHKYKEHDQWEIIKVTNVAESFLDVVRFKVLGPFLIKEHFEDICVKELKFSMSALEQREMFVVLDKALIRNRLNPSYEGRIYCMANDSMQKSVFLKVNMFIPTLAIKNQNVVLFSKNIAGATYIHIHNPGRVSAIYKWKKISEEWHYVKEQDDSKQVVDIILSDILGMLDLDPYDPEKDLEMNMTKRYQNRICRKYGIYDDPINIKGFIYEIIENLNLMHKRYALEKVVVPTIQPSIQIEEEVVSSTGNSMQKDQENVMKYHITIMQDSTKSIQQQIDKAMQMLAQQHPDQAIEQISKIKYELESKTLYLNRKFSEDQSSYNSDFIPKASTSDICVVHTLDHVMGHLKLDDSYTLSEPSTDVCERQKTIFFFEKCGILEPNQSEVCVLHIPAIRRGFEVTASFCLDIIGGKSQQLKITSVHLDRAVKFSKTSIYLGIKPWYETFKSKIQAENLTNYEINFKFHKRQKPSDKLPKLAAGYLKLLNEKTVRLPALQSTILKTEGVMGFSDDFIRNIDITINDSESTSLSFRGQGVMPILSVADHKMPYEQRDVVEIEEEYRLLQKIYYFEIFRSITELDAEKKAPTEEQNEVQKVMSTIFELSPSSISTDYSEISRSDDSTRYAAKREQEMRLFRLLQTYVLVSNNQELPNATVLNQFVETERFLNILRNSEEICSLLNLVHQDYLKNSKMLDNKMPIHLKHFTTQPLPFLLRSIIWNLGDLPINMFMRLTLTIEFFGPGKLIASARTAYKIPGLVVDFEIEEQSARKNFHFYRPDTKIADNYNKRYRNMSERLLDAKTDPKLHHAHSYDINIRAQHQRDLMVKERKWVMDYYCSLNKSVYMDRKHHFTHCKISTKSQTTLTGTKVNIILLLKAQKQFFEHNQQLEDYVYIDLHMGPTLPILLRGTFKDPSKLSSEAESETTFYVHKYKD